MSHSYSPELNRLASLWSAQPGSAVFAPLAEALRKSGALEQATAVAAAGVASRPDYLPGRLVMARIYHDQGQHEAAESELRAALLLDATHPVVLDELRATAVDALGDVPPEPVVVPEEEIVMLSADDEPYFADDADHDDADAVAEPVLTESIAMLYRGQGHLEEAIVVLDALVARAPENSDLAARRDAIRAELEDARPRPFDASRSGGRPVRDWLSSLAASRAPASPPPSSFDEFYQTAAPAPSEAGDLAAFQAWLRELDR